MGSIKRRLALIGAGGMLARMVREMAPPEYEILPFGRSDFDVTNRSRVLKELTSLRPDVILNCAAYTHVDGAEAEEPLATEVNGAGPGHLAEAALLCGATLLHISTDYVFDGEKGSPYTEEDRPNPRSAYGRSKLAGEQAILASGLKAFFIVRTSWLYGPGGKNFVETIIRLGKEREELRIVADQVGTPTYTRDLARALFNLLDLPQNPVGAEPFGIYHVSGAGEASWYEFAKAILACLASTEEVKARRVFPISTEEYPLPARRPAYSVFSKAKYRRATGAEIPDWRASLKDYVQRREELQKGSA